MSKSIKCPFCSKRYTSKELLYNHIQLAHPETLKDETYTPARVYFNFVNKKDKGSCVMCKESTEWNEHTRRYMRFCGEKCKEKYVKMMKDRMINTYGKAHLLNDPEKQKEMLQARSISGTYTFADGGELGYTGTYERDFLEFLDKIMGFNSLDVVSPCPFTFYYTYEGKELFYIPDIYIPSLNLIIEIKDGGDNPNTHPKIQQVDKMKEKLKDEVMAKGVYNYIKVTNRDHFKFIELLMELKDKPEKSKPIIKINEEYKYIAYVYDKHISDLPISALYLKSAFSEVGVLITDTGKATKIKLRAFHDCTVQIVKNTEFGENVYDLISESCMEKDVVLTRGTDSILEENVVIMNDMIHNLCEHIDKLADGLIVESEVEHDNFGLFAKTSKGYYYRTESYMTGFAPAKNLIDKRQLLLCRGGAM